MTIKSAQHTRLKISAALACSALFAPCVLAHTISLGWEPAGPGSTTVWYGTYHSNTAFTEGSLTIAGTTGSPSTVPFTLLVNTKPSGLVDGTNNFYSNGTALVGTGGTSQTWQGATFTGLTPDSYTFTYVPIQNPTSAWAPTDNVILSSPPVVLTSTDLGGGAYSPNANTRSTGAATVLDGLVGNATGDLDTALTALSALSASDQAIALQRIAPQTNRALTAASTQTISGALDTVQVRLDGVRSQGYVASLMDDLLSGKAMLASADNLDGIASNDTPNRGVWGKAFGSNGRQRQDGEFSGYKANTYGLSFGADTRLDSAWIVGGAFTYADTGVALQDVHSGDSSNIKTYQVTGYASRNFDTWYAEGMLAYAQQHFNSVRDTTVSGVAQSTYQGSQWAARATAGLPLALNADVTMTPTMGLELNYQRQNGYTESGAGALSMAVDGYASNRVRSVIGTTVASQMAMGNGAMLKPSMHLVWRHQFHSGGIDTTATFAGGGPSFTTPGQSAARNTVTFGGALAYIKSKTVSFSLQLDGERATNYAAVAAQLVGLWRF